MARPCAVAVSAVLLVSACGPRRGAVSEETGLVGVQQGKGALAGTWGLYVETHTIVPVPVFGDQPGGGTSSRIVVRTWDPKSDQYTDTFTRCTNDVFEVMGQKTIVMDDTLARIPPATYPSTADHTAGSWLAENTVDLWGARDLPDPVETPLPTKDNYQVPPQSDWMWDQDDDGLAGVTVYARGLVEARLQVCKRTVWTFDGTVVADDRIQGLVRMSKAESNVIEATIAWLKTEGGAKPDPDPLTSWFDMVRLPHGAACAEVAAAIADGSLHTARPF